MFLDLTTFTTGYLVNVYPTRVLLANISEPWLHNFLEEYELILTYFRKKQGLDRVTILTKNCYSVHVWVLRPQKP